MLLMQPSLSKFIKITPCSRATKLVNFQIISTLSNESWNKILPSLSQASTTHHPNVFTPILSLSEGRAGIARVPSNKMLFFPLRHKAPLAFPQMFYLYFYSYTILSVCLSIYLSLSLSLSLRLQRVKCSDVMDGHESPYYIYILKLSRGATCLDVLESSAMAFIWITTPCRHAGIYQRFEETFYIYLQLRIAGNLRV
jgi:hypothetical protein